MGELTHGRVKMWASRHKLENNDINSKTELTNFPEENLKSLLSLAEPSLVSHCTATTPVITLSSINAVSAVPFDVGVLLFDVPF